MRVRKERPSRLETSRPCPPACGTDHLTAHFALTELYYPEVLRDDRWVTGSPYVADAIAGIGEDPYSCGEPADDLTLDDAEAYARTRGVRLYEVF